MAKCGCYVDPVTYDIEYCPLHKTAPKVLKSCIELLWWAESVEGQEVSRGITKWKGTIFETAKRDIARAKEKR